MDSTSLLLLGTSITGFFFIYIFQTMGMRLSIALLSILIFAAMPALFETPLESLIPYLFNVSPESEYIVQNIILLCFVFSIAFCAMSVTVYLVRKEQNPDCAFITTPTQVKIISFLILFAVAAGVLGDFAKELAEPYLKDDPALLMLLLILVAFILGAITFKLRSTLIRAHAVTKKTTDDARPYLIMGLSFLNTGITDRMKGAINSIENLYIDETDAKDKTKVYDWQVSNMQRAIQDFKLSIEDICADDVVLDYSDFTTFSFKSTGKTIKDLTDQQITVRDLFANWQQMLRVINHQLQTGMLKKVYVVVSQQKSEKQTSLDSIRQYPDFLKIVQLIDQVNATDTHKRLCKVAKNNSGYNFENFDTIQEAFADTLDMIKSDTGKRLSRNEIYDRICIDLTGGQKVFSVVAAIETLNRGAIFSYVQTETGVKVTTFDASVQIGEALPD